MSFSVPSLEGNLYSEVFARASLSCNELDELSSALSRDQVFLDLFQAECVEEFDMHKSKFHAEYGSLFTQLEANQALSVITTAFSNVQNSISQAQDNNSLCLQACDVMLEMGMLQGPVDYLVCTIECDIYVISDE